MRKKQMWGRTLCLLLCLAFAVCAATKEDPLFACTAAELARLQTTDERSQALCTDVDGDGRLDAIFPDGLCKSHG